MHSGTPGTKLHPRPDTITKEGVASGQDGIVLLRSQAQTKGTIMAGKLTITTETQRFTAEVPTAQGELIATILKLRLNRGEHTPLMMESPDGQRSQRVNITSANHYTWESDENGDSSVPVERLAHDATESDSYIEDGGFIRLTTEDL